MHSLLRLRRVPKPPRSGCTKIVCLNMRRTGCGMKAFNRIGTLAELAISITGQRLAADQTDAADIMPDVAHGDNAESEGPLDLKCMAALRLPPVPL